ncbi:hypothetical protein [Cerasicoccus arenae]|uniref:Uncharacterized protein n=1 Tax=Cerasicoccus arenae TaxID=424488 RepID=A0A8J3DEA1_9BACT|nr:hypothetical protein [Cerasicoccus arenae]MBK1859634.1 hypothetical protein [Cerasicoccus arenae]GHB96392.1 hypothetical protein GCM10007047_10270 [Cerasicoccus arenae]
MKGFYDKIILAVGVLALAGSGAYYATQQAQDKALTPSSPMGSDYEVLAIPEVVTQSGVWNDPIPQDEKGYELYDVFTPPKIWWFEDEQKFDFAPPKPPEEVIPFGLKFVSIEQELYRIQLESYATALTGKDRDASISFFDNETGDSFRGKVGDKFPEHEAEIVDFKVEKLINDNGTIRRMPKVTIKDLASGESIVLTTDEQLFIPNSYQLNFETMNPYPKQNFTWEKTGDSKVVADVTFKLLEFAFDKQTASVEKTFADEKPLEIETLTVASTTPSVPLGSDDITEENSPQSEIPSDFDNLFQN